jgi:hypothetical protein
MSVDYYNPFVSQPRLTFSVKNVSGAAGRLGHLPSNLDQNSLGLNYLHFGFVAHSNQFVFQRQLNFLERVLSRSAFCFRH